MRTASAGSRSRDAYVKWFRTQAYYDSGAWRGTWEFDGGGALMNQAIHSVDLLAWLLGPVAEVQAQTATLAHERIAVEDTAVATLRFANGALGVIEATTAAYPGYLKRIELHGSEGSAVLEEEDLGTGISPKNSAATKRFTSECSEQHSTGGGAADPSAIGHHGHARQFADVLEAIRRDRAPGHRRRRRPPLGRNHSGDLQIGRTRPPREAAAKGRPCASSPQAPGEMRAAVFERLKLSDHAPKVQWPEAVGVMEGRDNEVFGDRG